MFYWKQARIPFLVLIFGSVFFVLGKSILTPSVTQSSMAALFVFPAKVPLIGWQPLAGRPLPESNSELQQLLAQKHYQYTRDGRILDIEMRYFTATDGDVRNFIRSYTSLVPSINLREQPKVGFYGLLADQQRAYLSACINPRGGSTVTDGQFKQNRYLYDVRLNRLLPWLLGRESLRDNRCLWAHLSVSLEKSSPETTYRVLENVWFSWYEWWHLRFPKLSDSD
ncbi:MAG: cyanoexosortase A system-associated protein [Hydrococcus sp. Prado102]|jgi:cyanosortase A-associated protein|nr:cyanoexosortase A system-associated protein [Hydrococcus sp. Prado102]